jgi:hypothetical protein
LSRDKKKFLRILVAFGRVSACPIDINPLLTLRKPWRTGMRKNSEVARINDAGYTVVLTLVCEFRKLL